MYFIISHLTMKNILFDSSAFKRGVAAIAVSALVLITLSIPQLKAAHTGNPSAELRVTLNALLSEHVDLSLAVLRNTYEGSADFEASQAVLDKNTVELAATIGSVYGTEAEAQFLDLWREHIGFFANHTIGLKNNDQVKSNQAKQDLRGYADDISTFFSTAIPTVQKADVMAGAQIHADLLIASMEAYDAVDYRGAYKKQREAHSQVEGLVNLLSAGIVSQFPEKFSTEGKVYATSTPSSDLRLTVDSLLREYVHLRLEALRNLHDESAKHQAALDAVNDNSVELATLFGDLYGTDAEVQFNTIWQNKINFLASHSLGLREDKRSKADIALENLNRSSSDIANFFATNIAGVNMANVQVDTQATIGQLVAAMVAYDTGDYEESYNKEREANKQVGAIALALATGITNQFPAQFGLDVTMSSTPISSSSAMQPFIDVGAGSNIEAIAYLKAEGIIEGNPDGTFAPNRLLNRAEFVKIAVLAKYNESEINAGTNCFPDVDVNMWYARYVCMAKANGIVKGYPNGLFGAERNIQVEEAYKVVSEIFYQDQVIVTNPWYLTYMNIAQQFNFDVTVSAGNEINRNEMATIIAAALRN